MRTMLLSTIAALGLLATPALAQSSGSSGSQSQGQSAASSQQGGEIHAMSQQKLRQSLEQAGFKNVTVLDATYLVEAQSPHGDRVVMLIDPPSIGTMSSGSASGGASAGTGQQQQPSQGGSSTQQ